MATPAEPARTTIRLPADLMERLRVQAQLYRRSWNAHVLYLLEEAEAEEREWLEAGRPGVLNVGRDMYP